MTERLLTNILFVWSYDVPEVYWCYAWNLSCAGRHVRIECTDGFPTEVEARQAAHALADGLHCDLWDSEAEAFAAVAKIAREYGCYGPVTVETKVAK